MVTVKSWLVMGSGLGLDSSLTMEIGSVLVVVPISQNPVYKKTFIGINCYLDRVYHSNMKFMLQFVASTEQNISESNCY